LKKQTRASGSLATFASFIILPCPSTTQTRRRDANCTTTSARPAARRSAGLSICVQISLVSRLGALTTGISRLPWRRSGRRRCALGQCYQRAFSIFRALDRFQARVKSGIVVGRPLWAMCLTPAQGDKASHPDEK
jgi:hypothetical protein